jgi:hypothetical protein
MEFWGQSESGLGSRRGGRLGNMRRAPAGLGRFRRAGSGSSSGVLQGPVAGNAGMPGSAPAAPREGASRSGSR